MSRIGKKPIHIPPGVEVVINGSKISVKGVKGEIARILHPSITIKKTDNILVLEPDERMGKNKNASALWGLSRALVFNMVQGVSEGYSKALEIQGVGYRAQLQEKMLVLSLGFSHPVNFEIPEGIYIKVEGNNIVVSGVDKELVGQSTATIRSLRKPEPYKGKGIRYVGEHVRRKVGKKAAAATTK